MGRRSPAILDALHAMRLHGRAAIFRRSENVEVHGNCRVCLLLDPFEANRRYAHKHSTLNFVKCEGIRDRDEQRRSLIIMRPDKVPDDVISHGVELLIFHKPLKIIHMDLTSASQPLKFLVCKSEGEAPSLPYAAGVGDG